MRYNIFLLLSILLVIFLSGCVEEGILVKSLGMTLTSDSDHVFTGSEISVYLDIINNDARTIRSIDMSVFNTGALTAVSECTKHIEELKKDEFQALTCSLAAPSNIATPELTTTVSARVEFRSTLSAVQLIEMITEDAYLTREMTNDIVKKPKSYSYKDSNMEMQIDFSEELPIVVRGGEKYMYITIRNIGDGFVGDLPASEIRITDDQNILNCNIEDMSPVGKEFPRIACELNMPSVSYLSNYLVIIEIDYNYEKRAELPIKIIR
jgi:hypothetical protein